MPPATGAVLIMSNAIPTPSSSKGEHTVEKIGGTSISRSAELLDSIWIGAREGADLYNRVFVVSAYAGMTNALLEHKKTDEPGVYALFSNADSDHGWMDQLAKVGAMMREMNAAILQDAGDRKVADDFVKERIEGARTCLLDLQRLCSYGHFRLEEHMLTTRELLSGLGEAHSAYVSVLLLRRNGVNARFIDLTGWRDENHPDLDTRIADAFEDVDFAGELPIVTGYAQCKEGLMREFDRGYSEVTFARIAALTGAREAVIHKEFHLSSADPKLVGVDAVQKIGRTNYDVADQLSNMGMEAIHPKAAKTLRQAGIPLRVANAFEPDDPGTLIDAEPASEPRVEIITGLPVIALEVFEQDMVGVKGYDATILEALTRHKVWIVAKTSNANTITHYLEGSLKAIRRVERDIAKVYPAAQIKIRKVAIVSAIGRELRGLDVMLNSLVALKEASIEPLGAHETGRGVDVQFVVDQDAMNMAVKALHRLLIEKSGDAGLKAVA